MHELPQIWLQSKTVKVELWYFWMNKCTQKLPLLSCMLWLFTYSSDRNTHVSHKCCQYTKNHIWAYTFALFLWRSIIWLKKIDSFYNCPLIERYLTNILQVFCLFLQQTHIYCNLFYCNMLVILWLAWVMRKNNIQTFTSIYNIWLTLPWITISQENLMYSRDIFICFLVIVIISI